MKLAQAILFAKDVSRLRAFYEGVLGLTVIEATPAGDWVRLDAGGANLALHAIPKGVAKKIAITDPPRAREQNPIKLAFHADDPEAERARLVAQGVTMREVRRFAAVVYCDGLDPEGNVFQVTNR
ncbi:MAG TPA: VOC family protein [Polyangiaceae bacterium]|jgi:catechol 2,3-dioxygenase-like lactoylglutathione lyase family enzyme